VTLQLDGANDDDLLTSNVDQFVAGLLIDQWRVSRVSGGADDQALGAKATTSVVTLVSRLTRRKCS